jgi:DNA primase
MSVKLSESRKQWLQETAEKYHQALDGPSLAYLASRGITTEQAGQYLLGLVFDPEPVHADYEGRLAIPFITPTGVVAIRYRCIADHNCKEMKCPKYLQGKGEGDHLYNVPALRERHPALAICEGEIDTLTVDTHVLPAIGVPGATKWKKHWTRMLDGYEQVFAVGDGDEAGKDFSGRLVELLPNAKAVVMPAGQDANSVLLAEGADGLSELILG